MICNRTSLATLVTLAALVISPAAIAQIYKCDGPNGPIYSDRECGPDAANVQVRESSGLSGVSEKDKSALAAKKLEREQAQGQNQQRTVTNDQSSSYTTESPGRWDYGRNRLRDRDNSSIAVPVKRPAAPRRRR